MHLRSLRTAGLTLAAVSLLLTAPAAAVDLTGVEKKKRPGTAAPYAPDLSAQQWDMTSIGSPKANTVATGAGVTVAVVDTGVDTENPEFAGRLVPGASWTCPAGVAVPCLGLEHSDDHHGHGTHVAGTVAAAADGAGVTGVAPRAKIMPVRVGDDEGSITGDLPAAIRWATAHGADVITMSIGYIVGSGAIFYNPLLDIDELDDAIREAAEAGILVTLSAGNDALPYCGQGELYQNYALCVGAYGTQEDPAVYSNWGAEMDVFAPGGGLATCEGGIWSTAPTDMPEVDSCTDTPGYAVMSGTSMAAPHAAGVGALLAEQGVTGLDARQRILDTAAVELLPLGTAVTGPRLDAAAAVGAS
jgi:subtilisin family serine protease